MPKDPAVVEQERAYSRVIRQKDLADGHRSNYVSKWDTNEKLYRGYVETPNWWTAEDKQWRSKVFVPISYTLIETIIPRLVTGLFSGRPFFRMMPADMASKQTAAAAQEYMQFLVYQEMDFFMQFLRGLKYAPKIGTGFFKIFSQPVSSTNWSYTEGGRKKTTKTSLRLRMRPVCPYDLWIHPMAKDINGPDGAMCLVERIRMTKGHFQMLDKQPGYFNIDEVKWTNYPVEDKSYLAPYAYRNLSAPSTESQDDYVQILEYHGEYDLNDDGKLQPVRIRIANKSVVISLEPVAEEKPYTRVQYGYNEDDIYGNSALDPIVDLQDTVNTFVRQRLDNSTMQNWGMFLKRKGVKLENKVMRPGGFFNVNNIQTDLKQLEIRDNTQGLLSDVGFLSAVIDRATGVNDYVRGQGAPGKQTAFEVGTLVQESHARFDLALRMIRDEGLTKMLDLIWDESIRTLPKEFFMRVIKEDVVELKQQAISNIIGTFDWQIEVPPYQGNRSLMATKLQQAIMTLGQLPGWAERVDDIIGDYLEALEVPNAREIALNPMNKLKVNKNTEMASVENQLAVLNAPLGDPQPNEAHAIHLSVHMRGPVESQDLQDHIALTRQYLEQEQGAQGRGGSPEAPPGEGAPQMGPESEAARQESIRTSPGTEGPVGA